jgi:hypothetical protein
MVGGVPFVDDVGVSPLLSAVAAARRNAAPAAFADFSDYLVPKNGEQVFREHAASRAVEIPWSDLSDDQLKAVAVAREEIVDRVPEWRPLFAVPVRFRRIDGDQVSATSVLIPQTVYLGDRAFASGVPLTETLVHEHAHIWLNFLAEVFDLQHDGSPTDLVLPSGTGGKTPRGVLFAAHFAAAAITLHLSEVPISTAALERIDYLRDYLRKCLHSPRLVPHLTSLGLAVHATLGRFAEQVVSGNGRATARVR